MSKELEALERAKMEHSIIKQGFPEQEYLKTLDDIEKSLEALEIIKKQIIDYDFNALFSNIYENWTYEDYAISCKELNDNNYATEEEYNLLREVLL